jgi:hypothetical protein
MQQGGRGNGIHRNGQDQRCIRSRKRMTDEARDDNEQRKRVQDTQRKRREIRQPQSSVIALIESRVKRR